MVYPWTDDAGVVSYPFRLGYATTLMKVQGDELPHATFFFDHWGVEAAGYVALSRVRRDADWRFVGNPTVHHFCPAWL